MIDSFDEYYKFTFRLCEALKFSPDCAVRAGRVRIPHNPPLATRTNARGTAEGTYARVHVGSAVPRQLANSTTVCETFMTTPQYNTVVGVLPGFRILDWRTL